MISKRPLALLLALAPALAAAQSQRAYIEIGSANFQPLPLALAPVRAEPGAEAVATELNEVLRSDLVLSGIFKVLDPKGFLAGQETQEIEAMDAGVKHRATSGA